MITVGNAELKDAERLLEIYDYYVKNTAITFEYTTPTIEEFRGRMEKTMQKYPYLVAEKDGVIADMPMRARLLAGRLTIGRARPLSILIKMPAGAESEKRSMRRWKKSLRRWVFLICTPGIGYPDNEDEYLTKNSADFHSHIGFTQVGEFHKCGYKFGRWYNMIWMEKIIGEHKKDQAPVIGFKGAL